MVFFAVTMGALQLVVDAASELVRHPDFFWPKSFFVNRKGFARNAALVLFHSSCSCGPVLLRSGAPDLGLEC